MILSNFPAISLSDLHLISCRGRCGRPLNLGLDYLPLPSSLSVSVTPKFTSNLTMRLGAHTHSTDKPYIAASIPARDRVIEFGKYRGKMLGTLPSRYLRWISKNLRARDFEEWSKFAGESHSHSSIHSPCLFRPSGLEDYDRWMISGGSCFII